MPARNKCASLFGPFVGCEAKKFFSTHGGVFLRNFCEIYVVVKNSFLFGIAQNAQDYEI